jgi:hypothetical protein
MDTIISSNLTSSSCQAITPGEKGAMSVLRRINDVLFKTRNVPVYLSLSMLAITRKKGEIRTQLCETPGS